MLGGQKKRKDRKSQKSRSEEKVVGFSSASIFPARKWEAVTQGGTIRSKMNATLTFPKDVKDVTIDGLCGVKEDEDTLELNKRRKAPQCKRKQSVYKSTET